KGDADHQPVAALDPCGKIEAARGAVGQPEVPPRALRLVIRRRFVLIVVGVPLELEQQRLPWGLVLRAAEDSSAAPEIPTQIESAAFADFLLADVASHVAPADSDAHVERAVTLAARKVFAGEQPRADDISESHRKLGRVSRFAPQA